MNPRLSEFVRVFDDALDTTLCERIIRRFDADSRHVRNDIEGHKSFDELVLQAQVEWAETITSLRETREKLFARYQGQVQGRFPKEVDFEAFRVKRYRPEEDDQFRPHVDAYDNTTGRRVLVCFWYLNDVAEGGETEFPHLRLRVTPRRGRAILFPPFWMYEHAGLPPVSGPKYIISTYFLFAK